MLGFPRGLILITRAMIQNTEVDKSNGENESAANDPKTRRFFSPKNLVYLKCKLFAFASLVLLLGSYSLFGYIAYLGYQKIEGLKEENQDLRMKLEKPEGENDEVTIEDLKKHIEEKEEEIRKYQEEIQRLNGLLNKVSEELEKFKPKDIRQIDYKRLKNINQNAGDYWLNPLYYDVNVDGKLDLIIGYKTAGPGEFLNLFVYSYLDCYELREILKAEGYQKGSYRYIEEENVLEITSQAGTPDSPFTAKSRFRWDPSKGQMILEKKD